MSNQANQIIKSTFSANHVDLAGAIINELMDAELVDLSEPEARAEVANAIYAVFEKYEYKISDEERELMDYGLALALSHSPERFKHDGNQAYLYNRQEEESK